MREICFDEMQEIEGGSVWWHVLITSLLGMSFWKAAKKNKATVEIYWPVHRVIHLK